MHSSDPEAIADFVEEQRKSHVVLIYADATLVEALQEKGVQPTIVESIEDWRQFRNLDSQISIGDDNNEAANEGHQVLVGLSEVSFRGIDYRAPQSGMLLLLTKPFSSQRAYTQALDRVGRFGDRCKRYLVKGVPTVDKDVEQNNLAMLFNISTSKNFSAAHQGRGANNNAR